MYINNININISGATIFDGVGHAKRGLATELLGELSNRVAINMTTIIIVFAIILITLIGNTIINNDK